MYAASYLKPKLISTCGPIKPCLSEAALDLIPDGDWILALQYGTRYEENTHTTSLDTTRCGQACAYATCYYLATK